MIPESILNGNNAQGSGDGNALAIVELIRDSVNDALSEYKALNHTVVPLDSPTLGPLDKAEATTPKLRRAILTMNAACAQLSATLTRPAMMLMTVSSINGNHLLIKI